MAPWWVPWHAMGGTTATPAAAATALHRNLTAFLGNPHAIAMSTAPRLGIGLGFGIGSNGMLCIGPWKVPWYGVEDAVEGLPPVVVRHATACREKGR